MKTKWSLVPLSSFVWVCVNEIGSVVAIMKRKKKFNI